MLKAFYNKKMNDKYIQQCREMVLQKVNKTATDKWTDKELSALARQYI